VDGQVPSPQSHLQQWEGELTIGTPIAPRAMWSARMATCEDTIHVLQGLIIEYTAQEGVVLA
jgi:hypothetical protein